MTSKRLRSEQVEVERFSQLSPKHQRVVQYVAENPSFAAFATASQLGERIGASSATVVRLAQALGFNGYGEFQQNVRHGYLRTLHPMEVLQRQPQDGRNLFETQLYQDIENLRRTLQSLHTGRLTDVARRVDSAVETVIISSGTHSSVAIVFAAHLRFMGYRAFVEDRGGPHLTAAIAPLNSRDLLIGISFWKGVREIVKAAEWGSKRGIPTVGITDTIYSPLAKAADLSIVLPTEGTSFFQSMVAPLSIINGLVAHLAQEAGPARKQAMKEAEKSYDLLDCLSESGKRTQRGVSPNARIGSLVGAVPGTGRMDDRPTAKGDVRRTSNRARPRLAVPRADRSDE
jgi:DNA-binding MurR/RpiR family transcriptional regulator